MSKHFVLRHQRSSSALRNHEPRVEAGVAGHEEGREMVACVGRWTRESHVDEALETALGDVRELGDADGQVVQALAGVLRVEKNRRERERDGESEKKKGARKMK